MKYVQASQLAATDIDDSTVIMSFGSQRFFHELNSTASDVWKQLKEPKAPDELVQFLMTDYDVEEEVAKKDVDQLLNEFQKQELIHALEE